MNPPQTRWNYWADDVADTKWALIEDTRSGDDENDATLFTKRKALRVALLALGAEAARGAALIASAGLGPVSPFSS
jgi:hypothetical protein